MAQGGKNVVIRMNNGTTATPDWRAVAQQQGFSRQMQRQNQTASHKDASAQVVVAGPLTIRYRVNGLFVRDDFGQTQLKSAMQNGEEVLLQLRDTGDDIEEVLCTIDTLEETHNDGEFSTYNAELTVSGDPTEL
jgi:TP901-1 family phage major tail protein